MFTNLQIVQSTIERAMLFDRLVKARQILDNADLYHQTTTDLARDQVREISRILEMRYEQK